MSQENIKAADVADPSNDGSQDAAKPQKDGEQDNTEIEKGLQQVRREKLLQQQLQVIEKLNLPEGVKLLGKAYCSTMSDIDVKQSLMRQEFSTEIGRLERKLDAAATGGDAKVAELRKDLAEQTSEIAELQKNLETIEQHTLAAIKQHTSDIAELQKNLAAIEQHTSDITQIRKDIVQIRKDLVATRSMLLQGAVVEIKFPEAEKAPSDDDDGAADDQEKSAESGNKSPESGVE